MKRPWKIGTKVRLGRSGSLLHVRGYVDDRVIFREWSPHRRRWAYTTDNVACADLYTVEGVDRSEEAQDRG